MMELAQGPALISACINPFLFTRGGRLSVTGVWSPDSPWHGLWEHWGPGCSMSYMCGSMTGSSHAGLGLGLAGGPCQHPPPSPPPRVQSFVRRGSLCADEGNGHSGTPCLCRGLCVRSGSLHKLLSGSPPARPRVSADEERNSCRVIAATPRLRHKPV